MAWAEFIIAFGVFFLSHSIPVRPPVRPFLVRVLGGRGFTLAYSALSLGLLVWLIVAAGRAPFVALWVRAPWQSWLALALMLAACLIVALSLGRPNPFSFGGAGNARFDPAHPGLVGWMRHPLLVALALWAGVHLLANGDLAHVILFGVFAAFALLGQGLIDRRQKRVLGADWQALWRARARPSPLALLRAHPVRIGVGVALYAALLWLHPLVIGVTPLP